MRECKIWVLGKLTGFSDLLQVETSGAEKYELENQEIVVLGKLTGFSDLLQVETSGAEKYELENQEIVVLE